MTRIERQTQAGDALAQLRHEAPNRETIYYVYVIDDGRHLRGFVSLRKLILQQHGRERPRERWLKRIGADDAAPRADHARAEPRHRDGCRYIHGHPSSGKRPTRGVGVGLAFDSERSLGQRLADDLRSAFKVERLQGLLQPLCHELVGVGVDDENARS